MNITEQGIEFESFTLDPSISVSNAIISHAHADHAATKSNTMYCTHATKRIIEKRYGYSDIHSYEFQEPFQIGRYEIQFHPAGHILGSALIEVRDNEKTWLYTGDFATHSNPTTRNTYPVECDVLITETTFALPVFTWPKAQDEIEKLVRWYHRNKQAEKASLCYCYSLGKAQRILSLLKDTDVIPYCHHTVRDMNYCYEEEGVNLGEWKPFSLKKDSLQSQLLLLPPQLQETPTIQKAHASTGFASGWMQIRGNKTWKGYDAGFVISDHCDWKSLVDFVKACNPSEVHTVHGYTDVFSRYVKEELL